MGRAGKRLVLMFYEAVYLLLLFVWALDDLVLREQLVQRRKQFL